MRCKQAIALVIIFFILRPSLAQQYNRDSISRRVEQIRKSNLDTGHIRQLRDLAYDIGESDSSLSKQLLTEALEKSFVLKDASAITNSYRMLGLWYKGIDQKDKALEYYQISLQTAIKNKLYYLEAGACFEISNIKYWKGEYDSCIDYCLRAQEIFEDPKVFEYKSLTQRILDKKKSDLYANMSAVFNTLKNLPKADEYIDKALAIAERYKNKTIIAIYSQQKADNYFEYGNIEKALRIRLKYLPELETFGLAKTLLQSYYHNIALEYYELERKDSSKIFAQKSLQIATELEVPDVLANANWMMGKLAMKEKQFMLAEEYFKKGSKYFLQSDDPHEQRTYYDGMHQLMAATGNYKDAYRYFTSYHILNDSILNSERTKQYSEREARYQSGKKDTQIQLQKVSLQQKSSLNILLTGAVLALLLIAFLAYRNYKNKQTLQQRRIAELETEKKLTATEAILKGEEQERTRLAKDLHDGLGGMLSGIKYTLNTMKGNLIMTPDNAQAFERSIDMLDSSIKEMRRVAHNMMPEALVKFGLDAALKDFCNDINQSGALQVNYQSIGMDGAQIEQTTSITIYRIVQELLNNTMKHAAAKNTIVQVTKSENILSVTVEDDGKGFDKEILKASKGIGWDNIQNRVEFLKGRLDVHSQPGNGTSVNIEFTL
ncbi:MAG: hypothetical protein JST17_04630 [Bacteroidetes bacterium]|nr:hypothetical protein [Bacteroidota bacterium]MBS1929695.1 hypothetical protein [Bacteroidota bacterium]